MPDRPDPRERFEVGIDCPRPLAGRRNRAFLLAWAFALAITGAVATHAALGRSAWASTGRVYDPATTPRAKYVPPTAPWPAPSYRAKDFTIVKKGGNYHLFYTRVQRFVYRHYKSATREILNETTFGHAVSPDLENWTEMDTVLHVRPALWDAHHLWAPTYVEIEGVSYLYYTGVRDTQWTSAPADWGPKRQLIGIAATIDPSLRNWIQISNPVWGPCGTAGLPGVPWALCLPTVPRGTADFRDPFVIPPAPGSLTDPIYLFYTARVRTDQHNYVAGAAQASSAAGPFTDLGALWDTYYPPINSKVESPHVFRRADGWHLFFSGDNLSTGIAWHSSTTGVLGPWTRRGPIASFLVGQPDTPYSFTLDPWAWFASEYFTEDHPSNRAEYLAVVHAYEAPAAYNPPAPTLPEDVSTIEFRQMLWQPDGLFRLEAPNPVRQVAWSQAQVNAGDRIELRLTVEGATDRLVDLEYAMRYRGEESIVPAAAMAMPASRMLLDGTLVLAWTARNPFVSEPVEWAARVVSQPLRAEARVTVNPVPGGSTDLVDDALPYVKPPGGRHEIDPGESAKTGGTSGTGDASKGGAGPPLGLSAVRPVAPGAHEIRLALPEAAPGRLDIFDVTGRQVRAFGARAYSAGTTIERWDGLNDAGQPVAHGIYFARATTALGVRTARLLVLD